MEVSSGGVECKEWKKSCAAAVQYCHITKAEFDPPSNSHAEAIELHPPSAFFPCTNRAARTDLANLELLGRGLARFLHTRD